MQLLTQLELLKGFTIIDLSHRLPGPYCTQILTQMGAKVIKIEDTSFKDPFYEGVFHSFDSSFRDWYDELNKNKEIIRLDFKNTEQTKEKIEKYLMNAQGICMGLPLKVQKKLGITYKDLENKNYNLGIVEILASKNSHHNHLHDINALAETGILELYISNKKEKILPPPFLPIAGMTVGMRAAHDLLGCMLKATREKKSFRTQTYLLESTQDSIRPFWPQKCQNEQKYKFLHNGAFPCYCLYQTADGGYLAMAAVEEKFWQEVCDLFKFDLKGDARFNTNPESFEKIAKIINAKSSDELSNLLKGKDLCLNIIRRKNLISIKNS